MKHRILATAAAVITFAGIGTAMAAGPARADTAGSFRICQLNDKSECLVSNGPGNQVTIGTSSYADFHVVNERIVDGGEVGEYQFENAAGNCLRAGDGNVVKLENGACSGDADWWKDSGTEIISVQYGDPMLAHHDTSGDNVWHETSVSGDWVQWTGQPVIQPQ